MGRAVLCTVMGLAVASILLPLWLLGGDLGKGTLALLICVMPLTVCAVASVVIMRTEIRQDEEGAVELRLWPYCRRRLPAASILSVEPTDRWTYAAGYGYRFLGDGARALMTGGPTITIRTTERTWVVTARDQRSVVEALRLRLESADDDGGHGRP